MYNFCTLFDKNYLARGLALLNSLHQYLNEFNLYVLCLDEQVKIFFSSNVYQNVKLIELQNLEDAFPELRTIKRNRAIIDYYFTLSPYLPLYILKKHPNLASICSLDADILFFSSPKDIFEKLDTYSIVITPHKYADAIKQSRLEPFGRYNVSFQIFKNNDVGRACLAQWQQQCAEWCYDFFDEKGQRFADQKYLDSWLGDFPNEVYELADSVTGLAVWNINAYKFSYNSSDILVDGQKLIFYHFHDFKIIHKNFALNGFSHYSVNNNDDALINGIYKRYWNKLEEFDKLINIKVNNSVRSDFRRKTLVLLITHETAFAKFFNQLFKLNFTFTYKLIKRLKKQNVLPN